MAHGLQIFTYLPRKLIDFLTLIQTERGLKSRSTTIKVIIEDYHKLYAPEIFAFLEREATKRGYKTNDLLTTAVDVVRDVMRGVIG